MTNQSFRRIVTVPEKKRMTFLIKCKSIEDFCGECKSQDISYSRKINSLMDQWTKQQRDKKSSAA